MIMLLSVVPYIAMAMNTKEQGQILRGKLELALLLESRNEARIKAARRDYVTPRSAERTQRLSASSCAPIYETEKAASHVTKLSQVPRVTIRKKTSNADNSAQTLYEQAIFLNPTKQNSRLNHDTSIAQKIGFDMSVKQGDVNTTIKFLNANNKLKTSYPLAIKLYAVMTSQTDELEIHPSETRIISVQEICHMAKLLADVGHNEQFLEKYARIVHEDPKMRKIIYGDQQQSYRA